MIYGLSDLHLDYTKKKSMDVFGDNWKNYEERIFENWNNIVKEEDLVLIPGDISWAMYMEDAYIDLERIDNLPGKKILLRGNHDYWWQSLKKLNNLGFKSLNFLQNNSFFLKETNFCGTRGWDPRDSNGFSEEDEKIFKRERIRE